MPQGMVTSLVFFIKTTFSSRYMGDRGSKSFFKVYKIVTFNIKGVKEQRVDGSSNSRNLEFVRYTLVAGKPVLGRKIYIHFDN